MSRSVSTSLIPASICAVLFTSAALFLSTASAQAPKADTPAVAAPAAAAPAPAAATPATPPATAPAAAASGDGMAGKLSYYGAKFSGRKTASGERFNHNAMTMAHKTLPFGTMVRITNVKNKKSVVVRVNDRGPSTPDRIGDLSLAAAKKLGAIKPGVIEATITKVNGKKMAKKASKKAMKPAKMK